MENYAASWLKIEEGLGGVRPVLKGSAEEMRDSYSVLGASLAPLYPPPSTAVSMKRGSFDTVKCCIYTPVEPLDTKALPVGVYYHPGGFVLDAGDYDDFFCRTIAEKTKSIIVSIHYRLSPEHKSPAHFQDAVKGFEWAYQNAAAFGGDNTRMYAIGVSAGAGLAISVARWVSLGRSAASAKAVKGIVALCPFAFHPENIPSIYKTGLSSFQDHDENVPIIDGTSVRQFFEYAALNPEDMDYFPALDVQNHSFLPPAYIVTCEFDPLRDHGKALEQLLSRAGVSVRTDHYGGFPHCYWIFPSIPEAETFMVKTVHGICWIIDQM